MNGDLCGQCDGIVASGKRCKVPGARQVGDKCLCWRHGGYTKPTEVKIVRKRGRPAAAVPPPPKNKKQRLAIAHANTKTVDDFQAYQARFVHAIMVLGIPGWYPVHTELLTTFSAQDIKYPTRKGECEVDLPAENQTLSWAHYIRFEAMAGAPSVPLTQDPTQLLTPDQMEQAGYPGGAHPCVPTRTLYYAFAEVWDGQDSDRDENNDAVHGIENVLTHRQMQNPSGVKPWLRDLLHMFVWDANTKESKLDLEETDIHGGRVTINEFVQALSRIMKAAMPRARSWGVIRNKIVNDFIVPWLDHQLAIESMNITLADVNTLKALFMTEAVVYNELARLDNERVLKRNQQQIPIDEEHVLRAGMRVWEQFEQYVLTRNDPTGWAWGVIWLAMAAGNRLIELVKVTQSYVPNYQGRQFVFMDDAGLLQRVGYDNDAGGYKLLMEGEGDAFQAGPDLPTIQPGRTMPINPWNFIATVGIAKKKGATVGLPIGAKYEVFKPLVALQPVISQEMKAALWPADPEQKRHLSQLYVAVSEYVRVRMQEHWNETAHGDRHPWADLDEKDEDDVDATALVALGSTAASRASLTNVFDAICNSKMRNLQFYQWIYGREIVASEADMTSENKLVMHKLRAIYAAMSFHYFCPPQWSITAFTAAVLGHDAHNLSTAVGYQSFTVKKTIPMIGIKTIDQINLMLVHKAEEYYQRLLGDVKHAMGRPAPAAAAEPRPVRPRFEYDPVMLGRARHNAGKEWGESEESTTRGYPTHQTFLKYLLQEWKKLVPNQELKLGTSNVELLRRQTFTEIPPPKRRRNDATHASPSPYRLAIGEEAQA